MQIRDKVFVVTGGDNGIGKEVALALLARGGRVAAVSAHEEILRETARMTFGHDRLSTHVVDLADRAAVAALPAAVIDRHGSVDGLVNATGTLQTFARLGEVDLADLEGVMAANYWSVVLATQAFLPLLRQRAQACVVSVASIAGVAAVPGQLGYSASMAAVRLFTEGLYAECLGSPVSVTTVLTGLVQSDLSDRAGVPVDGLLDAAGDPRVPMTNAMDAATEIVAAVERGSFRVLVGKDAKAVDGIVRVNPKRATELVARQVTPRLGPPAPTRHTGGAS